MFLYIFIYMSYYIMLFDLNTLDLGLYKNYYKINN